MKEISFLECKEILIEVDRRLDNITKNVTDIINWEYSSQTQHQVADYYEFLKTNSKIVLGYIEEKRRIPKPELSEESQRLLRFLEEYKDSLYRTYTSHVPYLWHISDRLHLDKICASKGCRDAYHNQVVDAVFASSDYSGNLLFVARCAAGGAFILQGCICIFPKNPLDGNLKLRKPVSVYCLSSVGFEPTIDYRKQNGKYEVAFSKEWILRNSSVEGKETVLTELPRDFLRFYQIYYCAIPGEWKDICEVATICQADLESEEWEKMLADGHLIKLSL